MGGEAILLRDLTTFTLVTTNAGVSGDEEPFPVKFIAEQLAGGC